MSKPNIDLCKPKSAVCKLFCTICKSINLSNSKIFCKVQLKRGLFLHAYHVPHISVSIRQSHFLGPKKVYSVYHSFHGFALRWMPPGPRHLPSCSTSATGAARATSCPTLPRWEPTPFRMPARAARGSPRAALSTKDQAPQPRTAVF